MQRIAGYSDPFYDLADVARTSNASLFLDIGCHQGDTLLRFLESGVDCPAAAFDPCGGNIKCARRLLRRYKNIKYYQIALSDRDGIAQFYLNKNEQTSSLLPNDIGNFNSFASDTTPVGSREVKTQTLDTWAAEASASGPCVIKCDTQGAEGLVIAGGKSFIREHCAAFYGEVMLGDMYKGQSSFSQIRLLLERDCGLVLKNIYPCLHDKVGRVVQMDCLWVKL